MMIQNGVLQTNCGVGLLGSRKEVDSDPSQQALNEGTSRSVQTQAKTMICNN